MGNLKSFFGFIILPLLLVACSSVDAPPGGNNVLSLSVPKSGSVAQGSTVTYTLSVTAGNVYEITVEVNSGDADLEVCPDSNCVSGYLGGSAYDGLITESVIFTAPSSGTVYILVDGWETSEYVVTANQLSASSGGVLSLSSPVNGFVMQSGVVPYTLSVISGATYTIHLDTTSGDADLNVCEEADCSGYIGSNIAGGISSESVIYTATYTGTLYIFVEGWLTSNYILTVSQAGTSVPAPAPATTNISVGVQYTNISIAASGMHFYDFVAAGEGIHTISLTNLGSDMSWTLQDDLTNPTVAVYFDSTFSSGDEIGSTGSLTAGVTYYLLIDEWNNIPSSYDLLVTY